MAYVVPANFRSASVADFAADIQLTTAEAADAVLTAAIARLSERFDDFTSDHFEPEDDVAISVSQHECLTRLYLPRRILDIDTVETWDDGELVAESSSSYRPVSSLSADGLSRASDDDADYLEVIDGERLHSSGITWPLGAGSVVVTGTFGWTEPPGDVKRAVALMVYDSLKPIRKDLRRSTRWATDEVQIDAAQTQPTGMPEVDKIIERFRRAPLRVD